MLNKRRYGQRGVSLLEVLVALFILTVVGAAILAGTYVNIQSTKAAGAGIRAEGLAKTEMEYVKSQARTNWNAIPPFTPSTSYTYTVPPGPSWEPAHITPLGGTLSEYAASEYAGYTVTILIELLSSVPYNTDTNIRKVTATVKNSQGNTEATIETYVVSP